MGAGGSSEREVTIEQDDDNESVGPSVKVYLVIDKNSFQIYCKR